MSANIKASTDGTQAIIGVGGVDQMTVSNAGVVTANSFVGAMNSSSVTATGSTTARTLANRFADVVNVKDFGAVGDGIADDRPAFILAANAATSGNKSLLIPPGTYYLTGGGLIPIGNVYIACYGEITGPGAVFTGDGGSPFGGGNYYWNTFGKNQNILQFDRWSVDSSSVNKHTTIAASRRYDGVSNTSAYYSSGTPIYGYLHYGAERASQAQKASGSANGVVGRINVFSLDNGTSGIGKSEMVPFGGAVSCDPNASITAPANYYNEFSINGPTGTNASDPQREAFMAGACFLVQKYCPGRTLDTSHEGSYGVTITTRPGTGGFDFARPANVRNYTLNAGITINGWAGQAGIDTDGHSSTAQEAYDYGILIGSRGSVWTPHNSNSKIGNGIAITDYVYSGLKIFSKHPNAASQVTAIEVLADAGVSIFGFTSTGADTVTKIQTQSSGQFDSAIRVYATSHITSERAGMYLGDWLLMQDGQGNGTKDFEIWDGTVGRVAISVANATPANRFNYFNSNIVPSIDNTYTCGANGARWSSVWAVNGTIQTSDQRDKTNIEPTPLGLEFINKLNPVSYKWIEGGRVVVSRDELGNETTEPVPGQRTHHGLLSQEVKAALPDGVDFGGWVLTDKENPDSQQALRYDQFIAPLIKAVKELSAKVEALESK